MRTFVWDAKYALGRPELDKQHMRLFTMLRELQLASYDDMSPEFLHEKIRELQFYCYEHFSFEERAMEPYKDFLSMYEEHIQQHAHFFAVTQSFAYRAKVEGVGITKEVCEFLGSWLTSHIYTMDKLTFAAIGGVESSDHIDHSGAASEPCVARSVQFLQWFHEK